MLRFFLLALVFFPRAVFSLPIDWHGAFGVDTTLINNYDRVEAVTGDTGDNASWQSYLFKLVPVLIVNDAATIKAEFSTGYPRGGRFGDSPFQSQNPSMGSALYPHNFAGSTNALVVNRLFVELYSDTATYRIGRHDSHFGLGAVLNSGEGTWDRFNSIRDGMTLDVRLGNFFISPFWGRSNAKTSLTRATKTKEHGINLVYKSIEKDVSFGILYGKKQNATLSKGFPVGEDEDDNRFLGGTDVKITDFYLQKGLGNFGFSVEIPLFDGTMGNLFGPNQEITYKGRGVVFESHYKMNSRWTAYLYAGKVSGDSGNPGSFEAMYLHPNYQIANLMFRYNPAAVARPEKDSIYDSYMTNVRYFKLAAEYAREKWRWRFAFIKASAEAVAKKGYTAFNHATNKRFDANKNQDNDLGTEVDVDFNYQWNSNIRIGGSLGHLSTGDYWSFDNDPDVAHVADSSYALQLRMGIDF